MINLFLEYLLWPLLMAGSVISFINFILSDEKIKIYISGILLVLAMAIIIYFVKNNSDGLFLQVYLFLFILSIALVILALEKQIDSFTVIGIALMITMLIILLRFPLI